MHETLPTPSFTPKQIAGPSGAKWGNVANIFWLGGDLHWTAQIILRGAPKAQILQGLQQSYHHISELGLADDPAAKKLASLKSEVEGLQEQSLDRQWRSDFVLKIYEVVKMLDVLLRGQQPGFRPNPES